MRHKKQGGNQPRGRPRPVILSYSYPTRVARNPLRTTRGTTKTQRSLYSTEQCLPTTPPATFDFRRSMTQISVKSKNSAGKSKNPRKRQLLQRCLAPGNEHNLLPHTDLRAVARGRVACPARCSLGMFSPRPWSMPTACPPGAGKQRVAQATRLWACHPAGEGAPETERLVSRLNLDWTRGVWQNEGCNSISQRHRKETSHV